eukprot:Nitzschia sp. Nitz4//scaffold157_size52427//41328//42423//NITZ4_006846-RA/size52427-snap-gene-0.95-mRNA-1//-1//CDS//3329537473//5271//frame0
MKVQPAQLWAGFNETPLNSHQFSSQQYQRPYQGSYNEVFSRFCSKPVMVPWWDFVATSIVVGQEWILTCFFLAGYRVVQETSLSSSSLFLLVRVQRSLVLLWLAFFIVILYNAPTTLSSPQARQTKLRHRTTDGLLMAALLRFLAAVLKTLTASYSSDTVYALAVFGFGVHLFACDYAYANGRPRLVLDSHSQDATKRPPFQGGTLSLTAAFFATTLLASRLQNNLLVYHMVSTSVVFFALYPSARHQVAIQAKTPWVPLTITVLIVVATLPLLTFSETMAALCILFVLCILIPTWNYYLQRHKMTLRGPWDIAHVDS